MGACGSKTSTLDADEALDYCARQVERALEALLPRDYTMMPRNILAGDTLEGWRCREAIPQEWCSGFWPGVLWMTYGHTGDEALVTVTTSHLITYRNFSLLSNVNAYRFINSWR